MGELGEQLPAEIKSGIDTKIEAVKDALKEDDLEKIKSTTTELEASLQELAQAAQGAAAASGAAPGPDAAASEEQSSEPKKAKGKVVDAEVVED